MLGPVASPPARVLLKRLSSIASGLESTTAAQWSSRPWVYQSCRYHYSERASGLRKRAILANPFGPHLQSSRQAQIHRVGFSTSSRTTESQDSSHVPNKPRKDLPSQEEGRRSHASKRFTHLMDHLQSNIFIAGQRLNDLTGYSGIEALKREIEEQGWPLLLPRPFDRC